MPDEVQSSVVGPNGEKLHIQVGSKSIGLAVKDLVPILLLAAGCVGGYLLWISTDHRLSTLQAQHDQVMIRLEAQTSTLLNATHEQRAFVLEQIRVSRDALNAQTDTIRKLLLVHDLNASREPSQRLPLELDPQGVEKPAR